MPDNKDLRGSPDNKRVNTHEPYELNSWAKHFGVSKDAIIRAVNAVGTSAEAVRRHLGK
jgi:hypothetical protein